MGNILYTGFRGNRNASGLLAQQLAQDCCLLTNSFSGLKRDIDAISCDYDHVIMFGVDRELTNSVRIERIAEKDGVRYSSSLDLESLAASFRTAGLAVSVSDTPTAWLCNEAYWHMLRKFDGRAVFIHIPTVRNADEAFFRKVRQALCRDAQDAST